MMIRYTNKGLKNMGLTDAIIDRFLGKPDQTLYNPYERHLPPIRLYEGERVVAMLRNPEFQKAFAQKTEVTAN